MALRLVSGTDHGFAPVASDAEAGFGIYVHWPFCASKCPYCDFNSHVRKGPIDQARYARAFARELEHMAGRSWGRKVTSIFFGGGTPSLMEPETVHFVLGSIRELWTVAPDVEISLEANPTSVEAGKFAGFADAGVNRVSIGIQALNDPDLKALGRQHSAREAIAALQIARDHFKRLSFDLIYARPGQTVTDWEAELRQALTHAADHLSLYQLTIEPGTQFELLHKAGRLHPPDPDVAAAMFETTQAITESAGLPAYEISNHAAPGARCRHNLTYWRYGPYVGVGPGAHGRLLDKGVRIETSTERHPELWLERVEAQGHGLVTDAALSMEETGDEMLVMGLRLTEGISKARYEALSGRKLDPSRIADLIGYGYIETQGDAIRATREGAFILDAVVADLAA